MRLSHNDLPSTLHAAPANAINIYKDVLSRNTVAIYFRTFVSSENESLEAIIEFKQGREDRGVKNLDKLAGDEHSRASIINISGSLAMGVDVGYVTIQN